MLSLHRLQKLPSENDQRLTQSAGFEPARAEPNRFLVYRLNHSAMTAFVKQLSLILLFVKLLAM